MQDGKSGSESEKETGRNEARMSNRDELMIYIRCANNHHSFFISSISLLFICYLRDADLLDHAQRNKYLTNLVETTDAS